MPVEAYRDSARAWLARTPHERFGVPHTDLYYPPMLELMALLKENGFQVWIVTGGAQDFVRAYSEDVIGVPPERVIGSATPSKYVQDADGRGQVVRRPVVAAGNSDNDEPMCRYAVTGERRGLAIWIHHDDGRREYDYGKGGDIEGLCRKHPSAHQVSMKNDWLRIFKEGVGE
jgi:hypothetical protein